MHSPDLPKLNQAIATLPNEITIAAHTLDRRAVGGDNTAVYLKSFPNGHDAQVEITNEGVSAGEPLRMFVVTTLPHEDDAGASALVQGVAADGSPTANLVIDLSSGRIPVDNWGDVRRIVEEVAQAPEFGCEA